MAEWRNGAQAKRAVFTIPQFTISPFRHSTIRSILYIIILPMLRYLHQLSAFFFYLIGASFFAAYLLLRNDFWPTFSALWLQTADLPFALCAILYGGLSLYLSLKNPGQSSKILGWGIGVPLGILFIVLMVLNFWGAGAGQ